MANVAYDMLESVENLKSVHFSDDQAKMIVRVQKEILSDVLTHSVAKTADIFLLKQDVTEFKSEIRQDIFLLKQDITEFKSEIRQDMAEFKSEIRQDMADFTSEVKQERAESRREFVEFKVEVMRMLAVMKDDIADLRSQGKVVNWMLGFLIAGVMALLLKLFLS